MQPGVHNCSETSFEVPVPAPGSEESPVYAWESGLRCNFLWIFDGLEAIGVNTSTTADAIGISVKQLAENINGLTIHVYPHKDHRYKHLTHEACFTTNIKDEVAKDSRFC
jgi:hypothetical protein